MINPVQFTRAEVAYRDEQVRRGMRDRRRRTQLPRLDRDDIVAPRRAR